MKNGSVRDNMSEATGFPGRAAGFSLVELLIAMVVGLVVLGAIYSVFTIQNKTFGNQEQVVELQQNVRAAMDMMSREIRMAGYDPADVNCVNCSPPTYVFYGVPVNASQLQVRADLGGNGTIDGVNEDIIYAFDAANKKITRNTGGGAQSFAENIESFTFDYLQGDGSVATVSADVRQVSITITGRTASGDRTYQLTSVVPLRN